MRYLISPIFDTRMTIVISHNIYGIMVLFDVDLTMQPKLSMTMYGL